MIRKLINAIRKRLPVSRNRYDNMEDYYEKCICRLQGELSRAQQQASFSVSAFRVPLGERDAALKEVRLLKEQVKEYERRGKENYQTMMAIVKQRDDALNEVKLLKEQLNG